MKPIRALAVVALLLSAAACDATGPDPDEGLLTFRYSGDASGTFEATGENQGPDRGRSYAAGGADSDEILVEAQDGGREDEFFGFTGGPGRPGTYTFGIPAHFQGGLLLVREGGAEMAYYQVTEGTLVVEEVTQARIRGRFSGTAVNPEDATRSVSITDGYFDLPNTLSPGFLD